MFQYNKILVVMGGEAEGFPPILQNNNSFCQPGEAIQSPFDSSINQTSKTKVLAPVPFTDLHPREECEQSNQASSVQNEGTHPVSQVCCKEKTA